MRSRNLLRLGSALALTFPWMAYRAAGLGLLAALTLVQLQRARVPAGQPT